MTVYRTWLAICLCLIAFSSSEGQDHEPHLRWSIAIHGGAGSSPEIFTREQNQTRQDGICAALEVGTVALKSGASSLDVVEKVLRNLEDNPTFNAGKGAVFNAVGKHELDASIMDGSSLACGAVAGVTVVKNPISLARLVMTETKHVLLSSAGADTFARQQGVELVANEYFDTPAKKKAIERKKSAQKSTSASYFGTVGCVVLDCDGNLAAGTSTGGLSGKKFGRVGDSPIIGAGTYADNASCAVSCTGVGEHFIRHAIAYDVSARMKYGKESVKEAAVAVMTKTLKRGWGGLIAMDRKGNVALEYNTGGMACGSADSTGRFEVKWDISKSRSEK